MTFDLESAIRAAVERRDASRCEAQERAAAEHADMVAGLTAMWQEKLDAEMPREAQIALNLHIIVPDDSDADPYIDGHAEHTSFRVRRNGRDWSVNGHQHTGEGAWLVSPGNLLDHLLLAIHDARPTPEPVTYTPAHRPINVHVLFRDDTEHGSTEDWATLYHVDAWVDQEYVNVQCFDKDIGHTSTSRVRIADVVAS